MSELNKRYQRKQRFNEQGHLAGFLSVLCALGLGVSLVQAGDVTPLNLLGDAIPRAWKPSHGLTLPHPVASIYPVRRVIAEESRGSVRLSIRQFGR